MKSIAKLCVSMMLPALLCSEVLCNEFTTISLTSIANCQSLMQNYPSGEVVLGGVPFVFSDATFKAVVSKEDAQSTLPTSFAIFPVVNSPAEIYVLVNATFCRSDYTGLEIGILKFHYLDGTTQSVRLVGGENIREWTRESLNCIDGLSSPAAKEVWCGSTVFSEFSKASIDMLKITTASNSTLTGIELLDTSSTSGVAPGTPDAGIFLRGITVSTVPEPSSIVALLFGISGLGGLIGMKRH